MRIISGKFKGRKIIPPKKLPIRPTTDKAKEALFNILNNLYEWEDSSALDLFSGSGNITYEFGSRGIKNLVSVEINNKCYEFIKSTCENLKIEIKLYNRNVFVFLNRPSKPFDIIFADPPYNIPFSNLEKLIDLIYNNNFLKKKGILIIEHSTHKNFNNNLRLINVRTYGNTCFSFFKSDI